MSNVLACYVTELITAVKICIVRDPVKKVVKASIFFSVIYFHFALMFVADSEKPTGLQHDIIHDTG